MTWQCDRWDAEKAEGKIENALIFSIGLAANENKSENWETGWEIGPVESWARCYAILRFSVQTAQHFSEYTAFNRSTRSFSRLFQSAIYPHVNDNACPSGSFGLMVTTSRECYEFKSVQSWRN